MGAHSLGTVAASRDGMGSKAVVPGVGATDWLGSVESFVSGLKGDK